MKDKDCIFYCYRKTRQEQIIKKYKMEKLKLVVFDMDGVLIDIISSWKYIHDYFNTSNEKSVDEYLKGKIDDLEFIRRDVSLWVENGRPIKMEKLKEIIKDVPIMKGTKECIKALKEHNVKTAIVSAGLDIIAENLSEKIGFDMVLANGIKTDSKGYLNGVGDLQVRLMYKDLAVKKISQKLDIPAKNIASVGNSCFDIPMFYESAIGIAFNPSDDCIKDAADIIISEKDLSQVLHYLQSYIG